MLSAEGAAEIAEEIEPPPFVLFRRAHQRIFLGATHELPRRQLRREPSRSGRVTALDGTVGTFGVEPPEPSEDAEEYGGAGGEDGAHVVEPASNARSRPIAGGIPSTRTARRQTSRDWAIRAGRFQSQVRSAGTSH